MFRPNAMEIWCAEEGQGLIIYKGTHTLKQKQQHHADIIALQFNSICFGFMYHNTTDCRGKGKEAKEERKKDIHKKTARALFYFYVMQ